MAAFIFFLLTTYYLLFTIHCVIGDILTLRLSVFSNRSVTNDDIEETRRPLHGPL